MKCLLAFFFTFFSLITVFPQGSVDMQGLVSGYVDDGGVSASAGQLFNALSPAGASISIVTEGIQQSWLVESRDTLLLLSSEMGEFVPGDNIVYQSTDEGYDEKIHRQVYEFVCASGFEHTMASSGIPTYPVALDVPTVNPDDGEVSLELTYPSSNPYDYPVGVTTTANWKASVAGQSRVCHQEVTIHNFDCTSLSPVMDVDHHTYGVVNIGYYCWTDKNMRAEHYANHSDIPDVMTYPSTSHPASYIVENFGHLYTWNAATQYNTAAGQGICPTGWHIPTEEEMTYVMAFDPSSLMSTSEWIPAIGSDSENFTLYPGGSYNSALNRYEELLVKSYLWTVKEEGTVAIACMFGAACSTSEFVPALKESGFSVRCVQNY